jgi:hypothetical protein
MLVCDGSSVGAAVADEAAPSCNLAELCQVATRVIGRAVRPTKLHAELIGSIAKREMSTYMASYGVV